jgi:glycosyltransferase involved in cell wall biosynthesis
VIEPGDANGLAEALSHLSKDTQWVAAMGGRARAMLETGFARREAFAKWRSLFDHIG